MERPRPRLYLACGLTLGVIVALLLIPATGSIVRSQFGMVVPIAPPAASFYAVGSYGKVSQVEREGLERRVKEYCDSRPDDYRVQLASALSYRFDSAHKVENLKALEARFGQNPSLYANLLRFECQGRVAGCRRPDGDAVLAEPGTVQPKPAEQKPNPYLDEFDQFAEKGEQLDPDNAFFPFVRTVGLFAGHKDDEAIDTLIRASSKPKFEEYYLDELYGQWQIMDQALGEHGSIARTAFGAALLFPQYAAMRSSARMCLVKSIEAEQAGDKERGFAIRKALARCGDMMRADGRTLISNLVGIAITSISRSRPGGEPYVKLDSKLSPDEKQRINLDKYCTYLVNIGHSEEAEKARKMSNAGVSLRQMTRPIPDEADWSYSLLKVGQWWLCDIFLLTNAVWMLVAGGAALWLSRSKFIRAGRPLPRYAAWAIPVTVVLAAAIPAEFFINEAYGQALLWGTGFGIITAAVCGLALKKPTIGKGLLSMLVTAMVVGAVTAVVLWQSRFSSEIASVMFALFPSGEGGGGEPVTLARVLMALSYLPVIPVIAAGVFGLASLILKVPVATGIVRSFRGLAVPTACLLLLLYAVTTVATARREAAHQAGMERALAGEGRCIAEMTGRSWEGRVE